MGCLDISDKITMMIDAIQNAKQMLQREDIRPDRRAELEEEVEVLRADIRELYIDMFKIQSN